MVHSYSVLLWVCRAAHVWPPVCRWDGVAQTTWPLSGWGGCGFLEVTDRRLRLRNAAVCLSVYLSGALQPAKCASKGPLCSVLSASTHSSTCSSCWPLCVQRRPHILIRIMKECQLCSPRSKGRLMVLLQGKRAKYGLNKCKVNNSELLHILQESFRVPHIVTLVLIVLAIITKNKPARFGDQDTNKHGEWINQQNTTQIHMERWEETWHDHQYSDSLRLSQPWRRFRDGSTSTGGAGVYPSSLWVGAGPSMEESPAHGRLLWYDLLKGNSAVP